MHRIVIFRSFFGRIEDIIICFRDFLTFTKALSLSGRKLTIAAIVPVPPPWNLQEYSQEGRVSEPSDTFTTPNLQFSSSH